MHAALGGADVVGEGYDRLVVVVVILQGHLHGGVVLHAPHVDHVVVDRGLVVVEPGDVLPNTALVAHGVGRFTSLPPVKGADFQPGVQKRLLLHPGVDGIVAVSGNVKHFRVWLEGDHGTCLIGGPNNFHGLGDVAPGEFHLVNLPILVDLNLQPLGKGVDYAGAHAVEAAGNLIAAAAELSAGVEDGKNHLQGGQAGLGLDVHGDATAIVGDSNGVALVDGDGDLIAEAGQGLVDSVVDDLVYQVVQARLAGRADVHAGPLADGLQALQDLDLTAAVSVVHLDGGFVQFVSFLHICHIGF